MCWPTSTPHRPYIDLILASLAFLEGGGGEKNRNEEKEEEEKGITIEMRRRRESNKIVEEGIKKEQLRRETQCKKKIACFL